VARLDFVNARIAARRSRLLRPEALRALLARPSLEARLDGLRAAPLGAPLRALPVPSDAALDAGLAALRAEARREARALAREVEGARARSLLDALLSLDEADAVKAVLRGVLAAAPLERTLAAAPPPAGVPEGALRAAAAATTAAAAVDLLEAAGCALAAPVREALAQRPPPGLAALELAADRAAFARALAAARRPGEDAALLARHLEDRVDARNAATLLLLGGAAPAHDPFLAGGRRFTPERLRALAAAGAEPSREAVARAFPGARAALARPWSAHVALERAVLAPLLREARLRPLSLAVPLAYLAARRAEVRRVAVLLRGAALGLPADELLDLAEGA
jgi:V/A-type H+-transporting ATPase subunit C